jgi:hypothetical protein
MGAVVQLTSARYFFSYTKDLGGIANQVVGVWRELWQEDERNLHGVNFLVLRFVV